MYLTKHTYKFIVAPNISGDRTEKASWAQGFTARLVIGIFVPI